MRKLFALLFVAAAFTFAACEKKGETAGSGDTTTAAPDPATQAPADTASAAPADTAAMGAPADTASAHKH